MTKKENNKHHPENKDQNKDIHKKEQEVEKEMTRPKNQEQKDSEDKTKSQQEKKSKEKEGKEKQDVKKEKQKPSAADFPIVAIGASAGGLEALENFFNQMSSQESIAFVVIQHKDPKSKSEMAHLLEKYTDMEIMEAEEGMKIMPNKIYTNPPASNITLSGNKFHLEKRDTQKLNLPVDLFFRSLSTEAGNRSIAVILSGTGSDGSQGLKEIKESGGIVVVQDPKEAKFNGMPSSAIGTNKVDIVCPISEMPEKILDVTRHPYTTKKIEDEYKHFRDYLPEILNLIEEVNDHDFSSYKESTIFRRIERRMAVHQIGDIKDYLQLLHQNEKEVKNLFQELLISVTSFFRDPQAFDQLNKKVIIPFVKSQQDWFSMRIWVPGCATGEEAFSIAILVNEAMQKFNKRGDIQIFATDIDEQAIDKARKSIFSKNIKADISEELLDRYFNELEDVYEVKRFIREKIVFAYHNLVFDPSFNKIDLLSCRNLLIYMNSDLQKEATKIFHFALKPEGALFLGPSENIEVFSSYFKPIDKKSKIFKCIKDHKGEELKPRFQYKSYDRSADMKVQRQQQDQDFKIKEKTEASEKDNVEQIILHEFTYPAVLVDYNNQIKYFYGDTELFLKHGAGRASLDILEMCHPELEIKLSTALRRVKDQNKTIIQENSFLKHDNQQIEFDLIVRPVDTKEEEQQFLFVFRENGRVEVGKEKELSGDERQNKKIKNLEQELSYTKEHLESTIRELQQSNDEIQSANEELQAKNEEMQSTNEELETSKEEARSSNEELESVNTVLNKKIDEITDIKNDLNNLLNSTNAATLFLDKELKIKRYSPKVKEVFHIHSSDIGRNINEVKMKIDYDGLIDDANHVLDTLDKKSLEKKSKNGEWYSISIVPYRTIDNIINGVVINFFNITRIKSLKRLATVVEDSNDAVTVHDLKGNIQSWNKGAEIIYGYSQKEALKMNIRKLIPEDKQEEILDIIRKIKKGEEISSFETKRVSRDGKILDMWLKLTKLTDEEGNIREIATTERDISDQKQKEKEYKERIEELEKKLKS